MTDGHGLYVLKKRKALFTEWTEVETNLYIVDLNQASQTGDIFCSCEPATPHHFGKSKVVKTSVRLFFQNSFTRDFLPKKKLRKRVCCCLLACLFIYLFVYLLVGSGSINY